MKRPSLKVLRARKAHQTLEYCYDGPCELCGGDGGKDGIWQDDDYVWLCTHCYWTRTDRATL